jgi:plasmid replication initiation protein
MLARAHEGKDINGIFTVDAEAVLGHPLRDGGASYKALHSACKNLLGEVVDLMGGNPHGFKLATLLSYAEHLEGTSKVAVEFNYHVIPYIENMFKEGKYTKIFLKNTMRLRSSYSVQIYELLLQARNLGKTSRILTIEELRHAIDIPEGKFKQWVDISNRILKPAQTHLREMTDIAFEYLPEEKDGRRIVSIRFVIFPNIPQKGLDNEQLDLFTPREIPKTKSTEEKDSNERIISWALTIYNRLPEYKQAEYCEQFNTKSPLDTVRAMLKTVNFKQLDKQYPKS